MPSAAIRSMAIILRDGSSPYLFRAREKLTARVARTSSNKAKTIFPSPPLAYLLGPNWLHVERCTLIVESKCHNTATQTAACLE